MAGEVKKPDVTVKAATLRSEIADLQEQYEKFVRARSEAEKKARECMKAITAKKDELIALMSQ